MAESPFELSSERISCLRLSSDAVQASKPLPFEVNPVQLLYPSKVTLAVEPPTSSKVAGLVVPMPTLPFCKIVTAGVEKVVPPTAVEGVISKASLTLYCAPANQLYFVGVPPSANIIDDTAPAPVAVNLTVCALAPTTSKRLFGPVVPMPTLPLSKILTLSTFDESDNANALPVPVPAPLTDKIADGDVVPMPTLPRLFILMLTEAPSFPLSEMPLGPRHVASYPTSPVIFEPPLEPSCPIEDVPPVLVNDAYHE